MCDPRRPSLTFSIDRRPVARQFTSTSGGAPTPSLVAQPTAQQARSHRVGRRECTTAAEMQGRGKSMRRGLQGKRSVAEAGYMEPTSNRLAQLIMPTVLGLVVDGRPSEPLQAEFQYDPQDPYAVRLVLRTPEGPNTWLFGRELLVVGQVEPVGTGDIHVWPGVTELGEVVLIEFTSDEDEAVLAVRSSVVTEFLDRSFELVGVGAETDHCDVDAVVTLILPSVQ